MCTLGYLLDPDERELGSRRRPGNRLLQEMSVPHCNSFRGVILAVCHKRYSESRACSSTGVILTAVGHDILRNFLET